MQELKRGAEDFGLILSDNQLAQFETYWNLLQERNKVMNLTAITDRAEAVEKHFLDSLALTLAADFDGKRLIDIGTGAGFPGLPIKIATPSLEVTLLDSLNKRVRFLEEVCCDLRLKSIACIHARAEEWVARPGERESYDYATSRAVAELNVLLELCLPYVRVGGAFLAMKTAHAEAEIEAAVSAAAILGGEIETYHDYTLPGSPDVVRRIMVIRKVTPTPERYPRRFARMQKQPL
ncbi:MAG: 16S rRNA (guanine(527)-N(7))-methyltransferase RsmG [Oscillospiraceae bacterium]|nr:16S rRNA (guanine(527)-N(7))-methyltransferase RsmG [Oscillospiraceae bacterium]